MTVGGLFVLSVAFIVFRWIGAPEYAAAGFALVCAFEADR